MKKYISKEVVEAEQYFPGKEIKGLLIGKNDSTNRWDDTPDGPYIISVGGHKRRVSKGDWVVHRQSSLSSSPVIFVQIYSDEDFKKMYKALNPKSL